MVKCTECNEHYIGETKRLVKSRVHEHMTNQTSTVYKHWQSKHNTMDIYKVFKFNILHKNLQNYQKRMIMEVLYINKHRDGIMNEDINQITHFSLYD